MPVSPRVPIPSHLAEAKSLREMCAAADQLKRYDTPQALPVLGCWIAVRRAGQASWSAFLSAPYCRRLSSSWCWQWSASVGLSLTWPTAGCLRPSTRRSRDGCTPRSSSLTLTAIWLIAYNKRARKILVVDDRRGDVKLSAIWRGLLWLARQITRLAMIVTWLMGIAGLLLPAFVGLYVAWGWLRSLNTDRARPLPTAGTVLWHRTFCTDQPADHPWPRPG